VTTPPFVGLMMRCQTNEGARKSY